MENLLKPDVGLMFWTVVTFLAMVMILKKIAWGPLLKFLDERETKIKGDIDAAEKNRLEMERLKIEYAKQMEEIEARAKAILAEAEKKSAQNRELALKDAEAEAKKLMDKTRNELALEKERILRELRREVGEISVLAAEKLIRQSVDKGVQERFMEDFIADVKDRKDKLN